MSDAAIVAREIQDLASAVEEVASAVKDKTTPPQVVVNVPEGPPPQVIVNVPEGPPPQVVVEGPVVNVPQAQVQVNPTISVPKSAPTAYTVRVTKRDTEGFISEFVIVPVEA